MALAPEQTGIGIRRHFTAKAPIPTRGRMGAPRRADHELPRRRGGLRTARRGVPHRLVAQRHEHRRPEVLPGTLGTPGAETSLKQVVDRVVDTITAWGVRGRLLRRRARGRDVPRRAEVPHGHPAGGVQLAGLVQHRRCRRPAAGARLFHPGRRGHDGLDPQLVCRGGHDLQGRLGSGINLSQHPLVGGVPEGRRHGFAARSASCAAPTRRPARSSRAARPAAPRRWSSSTSTIPTSRSSSGARPARRRRSGSLEDAGFDMDLDGKRQPLDPVPERQQLGAGHRRVHAGRRGRRRLAPAGRHQRRDRQDHPGPRPHAPDQPGGVGVRRPRHAVRHHDQPLAHRGQHRSHQRLEPVQRVHAPRQLGVQPRQPQPAEVPRRRRRRSTSRATSTPSR